MSYDRQLNQVCPHTVSEEALFVADDRVTVVPLRPVAAVGSVKIRMNGLVDVASPGSFIAAQATGSKQGPFNIQGGINDRLVIQVGTGSTQTLTLPPGNHVSASRVADILNAVIRDAVVSVTAKQQVRLSSSQLGSGATLFVKSGSTAAPILGLATNRNWRGQTIVPGWTLVNDPNTLSDRPTRLIIFDEPLRGLDDYVEVSYSTVRQECRRCGGTGIENDWRYMGSGDILRIQNESLLIQELQKALFTVRGSNPFQPAYGTNIINTIGKKLSSSGIIQNMIISDIYETFRRWQGVKKTQEENVGQVVTDEEYPFRLLGVNLSQSDQDPTVIFVSITVQNRSSKPIQIDRGIRAPLPVDLLGSTQQDSTFNATLPDYSLVK